MQCVVSYSVSPLTACLRILKRVPAICNVLGTTKLLLATSKRYTLCFANGHGGTVGRMYAGETCKNHSNVPDMRVAGNS